MRSAYLLSALISMAFIHAKTSTAETLESFVCKSSVQDKQIEVFLKRLTHGRMELSKGTENFRLLVLKNQAPMFAQKDLTQSFSADCCHTKTEDFCVGYGVNLIPYNMMRTVESISGERRLRIVFSKGIKKMAS